MQGRRGVGAHVQDARPTIEDEPNIPKNSREVLEDSDEEYELPFDTASDLLQIFEGLEGENLFLIQQG